MKITLESNIDALSEFYLQTLVLLYCPCEVFGKNDKSSSKLYVKAYENDNEIAVKVKLCDMGKEAETDFTQNKSENCPDGINVAKTIVGRAFCSCAKEIYGFVSPFGIITGIRPAKLALSYLEKGYSENETTDVFNRFYLTEKERAETLVKIAAKEKSLMQKICDKSFSLYVSIPFCPTKCSYCSFVSYSTDRLLSMIPDYLTRLFDDIQVIGNIARELDLRLCSVYVGGGTPSILSAVQIKQLTECLHNNFDMSACQEFTFEAGRPDTVDEEKLRILRYAGVGRISINTQTANDDVLSCVGRTHTFRDYLEKLNIAKGLGFECINTDLIAGLPNESVESFKNSIDRVIECGVENITVHSLTLKKASELRTDGRFQLLEKGRDVRKMLDYSQKKLSENGYNPYYIYRQKNTVGNLENTGYSLDNKECIYNIIMMEELHTVFSAGAGAVTKLVSGNRQTIDRVFNPKYPYEYLAKEKTELDLKMVEDFYRIHF